MLDVYTWPGPSYSNESVRDFSMMKFCQNKLNSIDDDF